MISGTRLSYPVHNEHCCATLQIQYIIIIYGILVPILFQQTGGCIVAVRFFSGLLQLALFLRTYKFIAPIVC
jgi:hypothetical protein